MSTKKPKITDIKLSKEKQDKLNSILNSNMSDYRKSLNQRHIVGECHCGKVPTKIISFDVGDGATKIEKYCDKCFEKWKL
jgi:hypothetical protein